MNDRIEEVGRLPGSPPSSGGVEQDVIPSPSEYAQEANSVSSAREHDESPPPSGHVRDDISQLEQFPSPQPSGDSTQIIPRNESEDTQNVIISENIMVSENIEEELEASINADSRDIEPEVGKNRPLHSYG